MTVRLRKIKMDTKEHIVNGVPVRSMVRVGSADTYCGPGGITLAAT